MEYIDETITWLKVEECFTEEEIMKIKELMNVIFDVLFEINGSEAIGKEMS